MTGSVHEAEDLVQETFLRAWKASDDFEGRSSVRTWLYRIATNVCLTNLESKPRRPLPTGLGTPDARPVTSSVRPRGALARAGARRRGRRRRARLDPARVRRRPAAPAGPPARRTHPARRAPLVGQRDRRGAGDHHRGGEQRAAARARPARRAAAHRGHRRARPDRRAQALLDRYVQAFWHKDIDAIVAMLAQDAVWEMPPFTGWYSGAENIAG